MYQLRLILLMWIGIAEIASGQTGLNGSPAGVYKLQDHSNENALMSKTLLQKLGYDEPAIRHHLFAHYEDFELKIEENEKPSVVEIITMAPISTKYHSYFYKVDETIECSFWDGRKFNGTLSFPNGWEKMQIIQKVDGEFTCEIDYVFEEKKCSVHYKWKDLNSEDTFEMDQVFKKLSTDRPY